MPAEIKLGSAFELSFGNPILEGMAAIGRLDGKNPSLVCATAGGRIMVHTSKASRENSKRKKKGEESSPAEEEEDMAGTGAHDIRFFNFNRTPTALITAPIAESGAVTAPTSSSPSTPADADSAVSSPITPVDTKINKSNVKNQDYVIIGSQTNIQAYDIERNVDAFFKDSQEAVTAMTYGPVHGTSDKLTFVGGNCSVLGFDGAGNERYWTVTSDIVTSLLTTKWKGGSFDALLAGSEDYEIRVFKGEEVAESITESDKVKKLHAIGKDVAITNAKKGVSSSNSPGSEGGRFAVALQNGTVAAYQDNVRQWRFKSKHTCTALSSCDLDFDGVEEILCGWSNGKFDVRADGPGRKGEAIFKDSLGSPVNAIVTADYRHDGRSIPIVCTYDGIARGYVAMETTAEEAVDARDRGLLEDLMGQKQAIQMELANTEKQLAKRDAGEVDASMPSTRASVKAKIRPNATNKCIDLLVTATEGLVHGVCITGDLLFGGAESAFYHADRPADSLPCPIKTERDVSTELKLAVMVGLDMATNFQVHDIAFTLPKFAMYLPVRDVPAKPSGFVTGPLSERVSRFQLWVSSAFSVPAAEAANTYQAAFISVRDGTPVVVSATTGTFTIYCDSMETCGAMVQDMATFLGLTELATTCEYPKEFESFTTTLSRVEEYNAFRMKLTAEMADSTQLVKAYVIKAEDARILQDMKAMKKMYNSLYEVNRELMGEYMKRSSNHTELLAALKDVNTMIQKASNLRVGEAKTSVVNDCRSAIKDKNNQMLFKVIKTGAA